MGNTERKKKKRKGSRRKVRGENIYSAVGILISGSFITYTLAARHKNRGSLLLPYLKVQMLKRPL